MRMLKKWVRMRIRTLKSCLWPRTYVEFGLLNSTQEMKKMGQHSHHLHPIHGNVGLVLKPTLGGSGQDLVSQLRMQEVALQRVRDVYSGSGNASRRF
jgi:hypothetical protein